MDRLAEIATILRTTVKNAPARLRRMKLGPVCGRCGGSGSYSYCQMYGSTCFECAGAGCVMPRKVAEWHATIERAQAAADDGTLVDYIARVQAQARCKKGMDRAFAAWKKMDALNGYGKAGYGLIERAKTDPAVAKMIERNKVGVDLVEALQHIQKFDGTTDWLEYDRVLTEGLARLAEITAELEAEAAK